MSLEHSIVSENKEVLKEHFDMCKGHGSQLEWVLTSQNWNNLIIMIITVPDPNALTNIVHP